MRNLDNLIYRAEKLNEAKIQYKLGIIYLEGDRVEPDLDEAKRWLERAADQGHEEAAKALASLEGKPKELQVQLGDYDEGTPPVIEPEPREQPVDFGHDLVGGQDCPHGHGPLREREGHLRCWVCGWPAEQSELGYGMAGPPVVSQPGMTAEEIGRKLGSQLKEVFGITPSAGSHSGAPTDARGESHGGIAHTTGPLSKVALMSGILGLLGFCTNGLSSLPAIMLGYMARHQSKQSGARHPADEFLTKMGLATGYAGLFINAQYLIYLLSRF